ncbi:DUF1801 domain-containing protein [Flavihumibacter profundi]|uniref:DUF1801 domain-containing protein n=1 Tax=Flavihumibacter profundi TaxID=2716883 RepID=UPI001CC7029C|nr:DUF1801 domain-containing protein [Flavihumibacter profundi]MBZ5856151.1 DUF1801 domain-containing protein [Flavihumibacter profundi]
MENAKASVPEKVDAFLETLNHPLKDAVELLRRIILNAGKEIGEEIKWNAPAFFYTGKMKPFNPKEYKRQFIVFNLLKKDCIRLVFPTGAKLNNQSGLLEGDYADGRRLALFHSIKEVKAREKDLQELIGEWLRLLDK